MLHGAAAPLDRALHIREVTQDVVDQLFQLVLTKVLTERLRGRNIVNTAYPQTDAGHRHTLTPTDTH